MKGARINQMIQDLCSTPESMARLHSDPEHYFSEYGLCEEDKAALRTCDALTMVTQRNVHPILAFHYLFAAKPEIMQMMSVSHYPNLLKDDK